MNQNRRRLLYFVLMPAIIGAAAILAWTTWSTASRFRRLGEQTIAENTLLLVREKVESIERDIVDQDNTALRTVDFANPTDLDNTWRRAAPDETPAVRAVVLLDDTAAILHTSFRGDAETRGRFLKVFADDLLPQLELRRLRTGRLKYLHVRIADEDFLLAYRVRYIDGRRHAMVVHHDVGLIVREQLAELFATDEGKSQYNVVGENNRRVYGPSLDNAGDYLVGHRFSTTLYNWRLQVAPKQAPRLEAQGRSRRMSDVALLVISVLVLLLGAALLLYAAAQERRLNALKGEFIANVSHELKTPLSVVRMFSELLMSERVRSEDKRRQYLEIIGRESERLSGLIENVLDFSALERGKERYDLREGDLEALVTRAIETFRYRVEQEGLEVELVSSELPKLLMDEQAIVLAVINLLDNAVKYGGRTPITVTLERVRDYVQIRVRDRGPGIASGDDRRVFERFYRGPRDESVRGSGIGLALVRHIAAAHGGRAWATNADSGGAMVAFTVPVPDT
ncbi:MAG: HAMP domain-containing sensor histidine kinase [Myxococcota bacterium]